MAEDRYPDILVGKKSMAPYPIDQARQVDKITTRVVGDIKR